MLGRRARSRSSSRDWANQWFLEHFSAQPPLLGQSDVEELSDICSIVHVWVGLRAECEHSNFLNWVAIGVKNAGCTECHKVPPGRLIHRTYEPRDEHPFSVFKLNLPH